MYTHTHTTGVCVGIYYEGIYIVKVILAEKRHFECPNEKVEENGLVTKSSILSKESLGWPNTQIKIHKYTNTHIHIYTYTHIHINTYTHIHINTNTQIYKLHECFDLF